jgi:hypothetical protein
VIKNYLTVFGARTNRFINWSTIFPFRCARKLEIAPLRGATGLIRRAAQGLTPEQNARENRNITKAG